MISIPFTLAIAPALMLLTQNPPDHHWIAEKHTGYTLMYTSADRNDLSDYLPLVDQGIFSATTFFNAPFHEEFTLYIHPDRHSLDSTWQRQWNLPEFRSECWMVASGEAHRMDMLSPLRWDQEACEHVYQERDKTRQLIAHELIHVFHGQENASPDFSNVEGIDWLIEGLATYVSGQCDSLRLSEIKKAIKEHTIPDRLDLFWSGKMKYGLSGSLVMYIDHQYGRAKLKELLPLNKKMEVLAALKMTESELLKEWEKYLQDL